MAADTDKTKILIETTDHGGVYTQALNSSKSLRLKWKNLNIIFGCFNVVNLLPAWKAYKKNSQAALRHQ